MFKKISQQYLNFYSAPDRCTHGAALPTSLKRVIRKSCDEVNVTVTRVEGGIPWM